jgi:YggT family protein
VTTIIFLPLYLVLVVFQLSLIVRIVYDVVQSFARGWRPKGAALVLASGVYTMTDPPLRWLRRKVPPLNLGGMSFDLAFLILFFASSIALALIRNLA